MDKKPMYVTLKRLKQEPGRIVSMVSDGNEFIVTDRGVPKAKIIPLPQTEKDEEPVLKGFGMWADREDMKDVDAYIRNLRKGRSFDI